MSDTVDQIARDNVANAHGRIDVLVERLDSHVQQQTRQWEQHHQETERRWKDHRDAQAAQIKVLEDGFAAMNRRWETLNKKWWAVSVGAILILLTVSGTLLMLILRNTWMVK